MPNPSSAKKANPFAVQRAKLKATYRTARFLLKMFGAITLLLALVMTWVLSSLFHLNIPMAFLGSIVACIVLGMVVLPVKVVWRSNLSQICQVEGPWELADELTFSEIGTALDDILSGRRPREEKPNLALALTNVKLLFIRKGEPQKALKIAEYLVENSEPGTSNYIYQKNTLACLNVEMGMYQHGMALLRAHLAHLESEERAGSPAYNSVMLGMLEAYIQQRRVDEAEMWLAKLKESIDTMHGNTCKNHTDEL